MKKLSAIITILFTSIVLFGQNLILNGDFEDVNVCCELYQPCSPHAWRLASVNLAQYNLDGNRYVKIPVFNSSVKNTRAYLQSRLADTLIVGETYYFSMDFKPVDVEINQIGVAFTENMIFTTRDVFIDIEPNLIFGDKKSSKVKSNRKNWTKLEAEFVATNPDMYIMIGCFLSDDELRVKDILKKYKSFKNYYYAFDNIKLVSKNNLHDPQTIEQTKRNAYSQCKRHPVTNEVFSNQSFIIKKEADILPTMPHLLDTIVLPNNLLFAFDSYELNTELINALDSIFDNLQNVPKSISIIGHTDNVGNENYNKDLSFNRAKVISEYLIYKQVLPAQKITWIGKGSSCPIESNQTETGRQKNRRVEILIEWE